MNKKDVSLFLLLIIAVGLSWLGENNLAIVYRLFAYPAAFLSSAMLGMHVGINESNQLLIWGSKGSIRLVQGCCGFSFFCILSSFLIYSSLRISNRKRKWIFVSMALPVAYGITIVVNTFRVASSYIINPINHMVFPSNYLDIAHRGFGFLIFSTGLVCVCLCIERMWSYGSRK